MSALTMTNYIDIDIRELFLGVFYWGHFTLTSCITLPKNNTKLKIYKITSLCKNLVASNHLFLPRSPLSVFVTNYIETEITKHDLNVQHWGHFTHTSCTTPPKNNSKLRFSKIWYVCRNLVAGHHLFLYSQHFLWLTTFTLRLENLTLVSSTKVTLHTPHASPHSRIK